MMVLARNAGWVIGSNDVSDLLRKHQIHFAHLADFWRAD
jgi:hypothetical protein